MKNGSLNFNLPAGTQFTVGNQIKTNTKDFQLWADAAKFWQAFAIPTLKSITRTFLYTASKYTPPNMGKNSIDEKYYSCQIIPIGEAAKNPYMGIVLYKEDWAMYKQGYDFKVIYNKWREPKKVLGYAKGIRNAKKLARIKNRGLAKYSWGTLMNNFTGPAFEAARTYSPYTSDNREGLYATSLPKSFDFLAKKSPSIKQWQWGTIRSRAIDMQNGIFSVEGQNNLTDSFAYCKIAIDRGTQAALRQWGQMFKSIKTGNYERLQKFFNFEFRKIQIKRKTL